MNEVLHKSGGFVCRCQCVYLSLDQCPVLIITTNNIYIRHDIQADCLSSDYDSKRSLNGGSFDVVG